LKRTFDVEIVALAGGNVPLPLLAGLHQRRVRGVHDPRLHDDPVRALGQQV
jgi:hypothetical protein